MEWSQAAMDWIVNVMTSQLCTASRTWHCADISEISVNNRPQQTYEMKWDPGLMRLVSSDLCQAETCSKKGIWGDFLWRTKYFIFYSDTETCTTMKAPQRENQKSFWQSKTALQTRAEPFSDSPGAWEVSAHPLEQCRWESQTDQTWLWPWQCHFSVTKKKRKCLEPASRLETVLIRLYKQQSFRSPGGQSAIRKKILSSQKD